MSELRSNDALKQRAHRILDEVRAGVHHEERYVAWALWATRGGGQRRVDTVTVKRGSRAT